MECDVSSSAGKVLNIQVIHKKRRQFEKSETTEDLFQKESIEC